MSTLLRDLGCLWPKFFAKDIVFGVYGDRWRLLKKICMEELLSSKRVQSFRFIREQEVSEFIRDFRSNSGSEVNLSSKIFSLTYRIIARAAFGEKCDDQEEFVQAVKQLLRLVGGFGVLCDIFPSQKWLHWIGDIRPEFEKLVDTLDGITNRIILERRASATKTETNVGCLLDVLLNIRDNGKLNFPLESETIRGVILDIFIAGSETSSTIMEWAVVEMLKNPRVMDKAQSEVRKVFGKQGHVDEGSLHELEYLKMVIKETLRFHPPGPFAVPREARESCSINGYYIPSKARVLVNAWAIGRDPRYWNDAETIFPERFIDSSVDVKGTDFELIPFGAGRRICPGIGFAMAEIELVLAQLLFHFDWKLPNGIDYENLDMTETFGLVVRIKQELCLIPVPYNPKLPII